MDQECRHNVAIVKMSVGAAVLPEAPGPFQILVAAGRINFLATAERAPCFLQASRREPLVSFKGLVQVVRSP